VNFTRYLSTDVLCIKFIKQAYVLLVNCFCPLNVFLFYWRACCGPLVRLSSLSKAYQQCADTPTVSEVLKPVQIVDQCRNMNRNTWTQRKGVKHAGYACKWDRYLNHVGSFLYCSHFFLLFEPMAFIHWPYEKRM